MAAMTQEQEEQALRLLDGQHKAPEQPREVYASDEAALEQARQLALKAGARPDGKRLYDPRTGRRADEGDEPLLPGEERPTADEAHSVGGELSPADLRTLAGSDDDDDEVEEIKLSPDQEKTLDRVMNEPSTVIPEEKDEAPEWAVLPRSFNPPPGESVIFLRYPSMWTRTPTLGIPDPLITPGCLCRLKDESGVVHEQCKHKRKGGAKFRQLIVWSLSEKEYEMAIDLAHGKSGKMGASLCRMMMRYIDGMPVDHVKGGTVNSARTFWKILGQRNQASLHLVYNELHTLSAEQRAFFFDACISAKTAG
jgi:hypothetical protein